jgi:hypothetical protein
MAAGRGLVQNVKEADKGSVRASGNFLTKMIEHRVGLRGVQGADIGGYD